MAIMDFLKKRSSINASSTVSITEQGRQVAESYQSGGVNFRVLAALHEQSPRSIGSIASDLRMDVEDVKSRIEMLARQNYVKLANNPVD